MTLIQQQRLLGTVLLLCLIGAIAFFFLAKVEQNTEEQPSVSQEIQLSPAVSMINDNDAELISSEPEVLVDPHHLSNQVSKPENTNAQMKSESSVPEVTVPMKNVTKAQQWLLQLGSFSVKDNAVLLTQKVESLGYSTYMEELNNSGKKIYRVRLKPSEDKNALIKASQVLQSKLNISSQLFQYDE